MPRDGIQAQDGRDYLLRLKKDRMLNLLLPDKLFFLIGLEGLEI